VKLKHLAKQVIEEKIQRLNEVDYEEIFSPETMSLLKKQSKDELVKTGKNLAQMIRTSSALIPEIVAAERPHIDLLEEIAKEIVTQAYPIIKYSKIKINASIGEGELPKGAPGEEEEEQPNIELPQPTLTGEKKRRIINGITQGASIRGTFAFLMFREYLDDLGEDMVNRYNEVMKSVFGIFDDENAIAMMLALLAQGQKSQGGESEAEFDEETGTLTINATAICFPMLVHEIVKGLYEILSLQGFGTDAEQNKSIVGKADQLAAEPNDMRFGKFIYDAANKLYIESGIEDDRVRDFFFTELYKIDDETEFIEFIENLVTSKLTSAQKKWAMDTMKDIERDLKADDAGIPNDEDGEDIFTEIKAQPGKTGLKDNRIKLVIQSQTTSPNDNKLYGTLYVDDPESNFPKDSIVYSYEPSTDHMFLSSIRKENFDNLPKILKNKNIPHEYSDLDIVSGIHVDNLSKYFVLKKNMNEIKVQPVNKLNKPVKKVKITDKPYIDIDTSFIEDYILDYGEIDENPLEIYLDNHEIFDTLIRESEYINFILNGDYGLYFNSNPQEIDNVLTLNDPLNIKDYAEEQAKFLSSRNPEDESFYKEEMIMAIETIQDNIPKYTAAKKILKDKFTIISNNEFSVILTTSNMHGKFLYTMILKQDGYFNKNGEIVLYTDPQI
jgi:hypothetical protein